MIYIDLPRNLYSISVEKEECMMKKMITITIIVATLLFTTLWSSHAATCVCLGANNSIGGSCVSVLVPNGGSTRTGQFLDIVSVSNDSLSLSNYLLLAGTQYFSLSILPRYDNLSGWACKQ